jgi:hypothetical protein
MMMGPSVKRKDLGRIRDGVPEKLRAACERVVFDGHNRLGDQNVDDRAAQVEGAAEYLADGVAAGDRLNNRVL